MLSIFDDDRRQLVPIGPNAFAAGSILTARYITKGLWRRHTMAPFAPGGWKNRLPPRPQRNCQQTLIPTSTAHASSIFHWILGRFKHGRSLLSAPAGKSKFAERQWAPSAKGDAKWNRSLHSQSIRLWMWNGKSMNWCPSENCAPVPR